MINNWYLMLIIALIIDANYYLTILQALFHFILTALEIGYFKG